MRVPRKYILPPESIFHFMWRCINGEFMLKPDVVKRRYLDTRFRFLTRARGKVRIHSYCLMDNHGHEAATLEAGSEHMSNWARSAHSSFCRWLNIRLKRRGPVAQDRPNTVALEDQEALKRVMFYGDWNPVKAGLCRHPADYKFSSYRFYAFGEASKWSAHLTPPQWYMDLGETPQERQARYREQCDRYYLEKLLPELEEAESGYAYGSVRYVYHRERFLRGIMARIRDGRIPRRTLDRWATIHLARHVANSTPESRPPP
jgi:putative transposase